MEPLPSRPITAQVDPPCCTLPSPPLKAWRSRSCTRKPVRFLSRDESRARRRAVSHHTKMGGMEASNL